ncbi:Na+/H+ antiporter NhaC [Vibrio porteresiae]|uniref:Na+/H+ antiporter NhaC n=1 Tax=Vibrio porteresiae DSM 19223 TaxID=1123496 RepID=A0ABZ0QKG9_9VIBR|nr:Na+/H+ antiporter NhaC [Vibrio porteresiae]WPC76727.1 Na+/H+ antiporter NhaC [Vibrio porteresiae DSM 19223]
MSAHVQGQIARPRLFLAILPIALTIGMLSIQLFYFDDFTPHTPLAIGIVVTCVIAWCRGYRWKSMEKGLFHVIQVATSAILIMLIIGMIIGSWIASGTVPMMIYYGFQILTPQTFLAAAMLLCSIISVSLGTSWTTTATVGLALMGVGDGFGIPMYWTAGAVVSGAFFGDKMSPLSDTTNLAPAVTGTHLFAHIRNMLPTTVPALFIAFLVYVFVGFTMIDATQVDPIKIQAMSDALQQHFTFNWVVLMPAVVVFALAILKMPAIPSLMVSVLCSSAIAMYVQGVSIHEALGYLQSGFSIETGNSNADALLNRGGIQSMAWILTLVLIALALGGVLEQTRCLETIVLSIMSRVRTIFGLQVASTLTAAGTNLVAGDPYLSIALPGRMYSQAYRGMGYSTLCLSRSVEEGGTLLSPLIPWNAGGALVIQSLGLGIAQGHTENLLYIVCAIACWMSPLLGIIYAYFGKFCPKATEEEKLQWHTNNELIMTLPQSQTSHLANSISHA